LALPALVAMPLTAAAAKRDGGHGHHQPTIAEVRAMPLGTAVTIEGTVTTPSGVFASSFFDEGFAVQDETAGIFVSFPDTNIGVQPPRHVEVTGVLQDSSGLLVIAPASVDDVKVKGQGQAGRADVGAHRLGRRVDRGLTGTRRRRDHPGPDR
jgi:hypothetical protein